MEETRNVYKKLIAYMTVKTTCSPRRRWEDIDSVKFILEYGIF
jgi:hypothetical protein